MDEINRLIEHLEKALSNAEGPEYRESMTDEEVDELLKARTVKIDALTAVEIIQILQDAGFNKRMRDICIENANKEAEVGQMVREAKGSDKPKAYAIAARLMGWDDGAAAFNDKLLNEYLDAIGVSYDGARGVDEIIKIINDEYIPPKMDKKDAIQMICKKHGLQSYDATYKRLLRAKKTWIDELEKEGKNFDQLLNILPENWPKA